jgi:hypothetical protein
MKQIFFLFGFLLSLNTAAKDSNMTAQKKTQGPPIHYVVFHKPGPT